MKKNIFILLFCILISSIIFSNNKYDIIGFSDLNYKNLCGVYIPKGNYNDNFEISSILNNGYEGFWSVKTSWGYSYWLVYDSITIDIIDKNLNIDMGIVGEVKIKSVKIINENKYEMIILTDSIYPKKDEYILKIEISNDKILKISGDVEPFNGEYIKIGGPDKKFNDYYKPTINNLRLRDNNDFEKVVKVLNKNDKVIIKKISYKSFTKLIKKNIPLGLEESVIDGKKGYWVEVETENRERGICFSGFLERLVLYKK